MITILVVEDYAPERELLDYLLTHAQYRVIQASNGSEALHMMHSEQPDLIILDLHMPVMDGYELIRRMHADPCIEAIKVIVYTSFTDRSETDDLAGDSIVALILAKPIDPEKISKVVAEVLKAKGITPPPIPDYCEAKRR